MKLELYKLFFDEDIEALFIDSSVMYATQKNDPAFSMHTQDLWGLLTILTLSSYSTRPQFSMFWFVDEDVACPFDKRNNAT